jgi:hypothetical protein
VLSSIESYSQFVYSFLDNTATVRKHTIRVYPRGARIGVLEGTVEFDHSRPNSRSPGLTCRS